VVVTVVLVGMLLAMLFLGALATSDRGTRRLMLRLVLVAFLITAALAIWVWSLGSTPDVTSDYGYTSTVAP
jgi:hypothetical protein